MLKIKYYPPVFSSSSFEWNVNDCYSGVEKLYLGLATGEIPYAGDPCRSPFIPDKNKLKLPCQQYPLYFKGDLWGTKDVAKVDNLYIYSEKSGICRRFYRPSHTNTPYTEHKLMATKYYLNLKNVTAKHFFVSETGDIYLAFVILL